MFSKELQSLLEEVADICDSGQYLDMKAGADHRYDGNTYGDGLFIAYQNFVNSEEGGKWYDETVEENQEELDDEV